MGSPRLLRTLTGHRPFSSPHLGRGRSPLVDLVHLVVMMNSHAKTAPAHDPPTDLSDQDDGAGSDSGTAGSVNSVVEGVLTLSQLCAQLEVSTQTIYDLRCQGRGPRGFRVGRELRFRASEIDAWLSRLEREDELRHRTGGR